MYRFPENLFTEVRIQSISATNYTIQNDEVVVNNASSETGANIRVYDGKMWYTSVTDSIDDIQSEIDSLAALAEPNPGIYSQQDVKNFGSEKAEVVRFSGADDLRKIPRQQHEKLVWDCIDKCVDKSIDEIKTYYAGYNSSHTEKHYCNSKGADIRQDSQQCTLFMFYNIVVNGVTTSTGKQFRTKTFDGLKNHEQEICAERDRYLDYARNAVDVVPGNYTCVLAPIVTAMFTHESFGHKSEADYMLNDKTLQDEWVIGKKVGNERVSICDDGSLDNNGFTPYDDEGNRARETWLITDGVLTGRLHSSYSAMTLSEEVTGNARAESYAFVPIVRMTNTYMKKGSDNPEDIIAGVKDGIYVYSVSYGTGSSTFTMQPTLCYKIRDGKLCEPIRANVITGSVFRTLFDIDAVGMDFELFDTYTCGKNDQSVPVSAGGPTIRVKSLTVN